VLIGAYRLAKILDDLRNQVFRPIRQELQDSAPDRTTNFGLQHFGLFEQIISDYRLTGPHSLHHTSLGYHRSEIKGAETIPSRTVLNLYTATHLICIVEDSAQYFYLYSEEKLKTNYW